MLLVPSVMLPRLLARTKSNGVDVWNVVGVLIVQSKSRTQARQDEIKAGMQKALRPMMILRLI